MSELLLHCGGKKATRQELDLIPIPPATESYTPVSHYELANTMLTVGQDILKDYSLSGEGFGLARDGQQMFGVLKFKKDHSEMALSIGFRNSYDRSMSIGFALGATVFVCDNLALSGEIAVMKKHTKNVWADLENTIIATLYKSQRSFEKIVTDADMMKRHPITDDGAFKMIGLLFGRNVLSPRQLPVVLDNWSKPAYDEFRQRDLWSFYNACTEALKTSPPVTVMERHCRLHELIVGGGINV